MSSPAPDKLPPCQTCRAFGRGFFDLRRLIPTVIPYDRWYETAAELAAIPANVDDAKGLRHVCPDQGAVHAGKGYCTAPAQRDLKRNGCHSAAGGTFPQARG